MKAIEQTPTAKTCVTRVVEELNSQDADSFVDLCSMRIAMTTEKTRQILIEQVVPFLQLHKDSSLEPVPSAAVGTLIDIIQELGPELTRELAESVEPPSLLNSKEYLERYEFTRNELLNAGAKLSPAIWPETNSIGLAETKSYKGCSSSQSYDYSSSDNSWSSSSSSEYSSSSEGGSGGIFVLVVLGLYFGFMRAPEITGIVAFLMLSHFVLARWIPEAINVLIWAVPVGWTTYVIVLPFGFDWKITIGIISIASFFAGSVGSVISSMRKGNSSRDDNQEDGDWAYDNDEDDWD